MARTQAETGQALPLWQAHAQETEKDAMSTVIEARRRHSA